jgi:hypothetical protein
MQCNGHLRTKPRLRRKAKENEPRLVRGILRATIFRGG